MPGQIGGFANDRLPYAGAHKPDLLVSFVVGKTFVRPVGGEVARQEQHPQVLESQILQGLECWANVGAALHRAATTIEDEIGAAGKGGGPGGEFLQTFVAASGTVILRPFDVSGCIQALEADENNGRRGLGVL